MLIRRLASAVTLLLPAVAHGQGGSSCAPGLDAEWQRVRLIRYVSPDRSRAQVEQLLLGEARRLAVQQAVGIAIASTTTRTQYEAMANGESKEYRDNFFELYSQEAAGLIVEEKHTTARRGDDSLSVVYEARVSCDTGPVAAGFTAKVETNQETYRERDQVTIDVEASDSSRVYLFSMAQDGSAVMIFPNHIDAANTLRPGVKRVVPGPGALYSLPVSLDQRFGPSQNEMLLAIFYRGSGPPPFRAADAFSKVFTLQEINRVLLLIPRAERTRVATGYEIRARAER